MPLLSCKGGKRQRVTMDLLDGWDDASGGGSGEGSGAARALCGTPASVPAADAKRDDELQARAKWERLQARWTKLFPWLGCKETVVGWGVGCTVCARQNHPHSSWAEFRVCTSSALQKAHMQQHEKQLQHRRALQDADASAPAAPPYEEWLKVYEDRVARKSLRAGNPDVGGQQKVTRMTWCLAESVLDCERAFLRDSCSLAIHQDARAQRLLLRFSATTPSLQVLKGTFGHMRGHGTTSEQARQATLQVLTRFCTPRLEPPFPPRKDVPPPAVDRNLRRHLLRITEIFDTDGGSDEVRCGRLLKDGTATLAPMMPNILLLLKDQTHAARRPFQHNIACSMCRAMRRQVRELASAMLRTCFCGCAVGLRRCSRSAAVDRLMKNPWMADPYLKETLSLCQGAMRAISNSEDMKNRFQDNIKHLESSPFEAARIRSLRFARQRFDSTSRPLGRLLLLFDAVWCTASEMQLCREAANPSCKQSRAFLEGMSEERLLQAALIADAADECMGILRYMDSEECDPAQLTSHIDHLVHQADTLFIQGHALQADPSFSSHALALLRRPRSCHIGNVVKTLGGPGTVSEQVSRRCMSRMAAWVRLLMSSLQAEFPSWHVIQSFRLFDLSNAWDVGSEVCLGSLDRLATFFKVDKLELKSQLIDLRSFALRVHKQQQGVSNLEAWRQALARAEATPMRQLHRVNALKPVLLRYATFTGATTSGVERAFSVQKSLLCLAGRGGHSLSLGLENNELKVVTGIQKNTLAETIATAMKIYEETFGRPRSSGTKKRPKFKSQKRAQPRQDTS